MFQIQVNDSDLQENAWLHLYAQVAAYSKWDVYMVRRKSLEKCVYSFVWGSCTLSLNQAFCFAGGSSPIGDKESSGTNKGRRHRVKFEVEVEQCNLLHKFQDSWRCRVHIHSKANEGWKTTTYVP